ncbi:hypothetical protein [Sphingomonas psychrotolerans]|uniref:Uncharacterized protein n=1 Tax=Sphingomonas psychrotolerans TaxID=1327635 RepID=A0A2K8MLY5_9SPHN|nr:hypothetical protein [Sphingomonas psychrotolerans]ATY34024.1 hypothetical protein CVN68_20425 [Sphingomonas psychrotolerans]
MRKEEPGPMLSPSKQAALNLEEARSLRAAGYSYRQIRRQLGLSPGQLGYIRRALSREKAAGTRLLRTTPDATDRDLPVSRSILPSGLRKQLTASGYRTLGDLADRLSDPDLPGLEAMPGIGPHKAGLVKRLLAHYDLLPGTDDLQSAIEQLFPEFADPPADDSEDG